MLLSRRKFFLALAAPAVIRVADLMPVKKPLILPPKPSLEVEDIIWNSNPGTARYVAVHDSASGDLVACWDYGDYLHVGNGETVTIDFGATTMSLT